MKMNVPTEDNIDNMKERLYEELEHVLDTFPKQHILVGDFNARVGREHIFKPTIANEFKRN
jgi:hypothetical protein